MASYRSIMVLVLTLTTTASPLVARAQRATKAPAAHAPARPAATASAAAPRVERTVPFAVGETLTYDVSWSGYLTAGTAITTVKEKKPSFNSVAYYATAEGRPTSLLAHLYTLYYKMDSLIDAYTLLPQRGSLYSEEGKRRRYQITQFDRATNTAHFELQTASTLKDDVHVPATTQDMLSAIYVLRALALAPGDRLTIPVTDRGNVYTVHFSVGNVETVSAPVATIAAWRIGVAVVDGQGKPVGKNLALWMSTDARRLPVKMEAELPVGSFSVALRTVASGGNQ